jgi:phage tail protein X
MTTYTTKKDDVLDEVVSRFYKGLKGATERVLEANRGLHLADYGVFLPQGLTIIFPALEQKSADKQMTRLWE